MSLRDRCEAVPQDGKPLKRTPSPGWEPRVELGETEGTAVSRALPHEADEATLIAGWQLDPDVWEIIPGTLTVNRWQQHDASDDWLYQYKAKLIVRGENPRADVDELVAAISKRKRGKRTPPGGDHALVVNLADWQVGKALTDDTPMLTPSGWTTHGELKPGDYVYGPDGQAREVLAVTGSTTQPVYRVTFDRGVSLLATADHRWTGWRKYKDDSGRYSRRSLTWTTAELAELRPSYSRGRFYQSRPFHVDVAASVDLPEAPLPIDPYLLGMWLGDGRASGGSWTSSNADAAHWLSAIDDAYVCYAGTLGQVDIRVPGFTTTLRGAGLVDNKHVPAAYLSASIGQRLALLQGLMDTDGHVTPRGSCEFVNVIEDVADAVVWLATSLGMKVTRKIKDTGHKPAHVIRFTPNADLPYQRVFRMARKLDRLRSQGDNETCYRFVQSVVAAGEASAQCITVEGSLYLAGRDLVVTHNSEGGGTPAFLDHMGAGFDAIEDRLYRLRKQYAVGSVHLVGMGDLLERCQGNYPSQAFQADLNEREQARVVRRLLLDVVARMARLAPDVVVACVGGNHGEARNGSGKAFTDPSDNLDVGVFEAVYEACQTNPDAFGHVRFHIPTDKLVIALDVAGVKCAWTHGHLASRGATPQAKQTAWWQGQAFGDGPARWTGLADAQVLTTAHYHHFAATETHGRLWLQCPSMDGGSRWFTDATGQHSARGTLTYLAGPRGVREIEVVA